MKNLRPETARKLREKHKIIKTNHANELTLDVTDLTPDKAANIILNHAQKYQAT